jgi:hypothetical protein
MQNQKEITQSPVQTKNEQKFPTCFIGRVLKSQSLLDGANAKIKKHYLKQEKEVIINDLIDDFQEKTNYELFVDELGLSETFESWKTLNFIRREVRNG